MVRAAKEYVKTCIAKGGERCCYNAFTKRVDYLYVSSGTAQSHKESWSFETTEWTETDKSRIDDAQGVDQGRGERVRFQDETTTPPRKKRRREGNGHGGQQSDEGEDANAQTDQPQKRGGTRGKKGRASSETEPKADEKDLTMANGQKAGNSFKEAQSGLQAVLEAMKTNEEWSWTAHTGHRLHCQEHLHNMATQLSSFARNFLAMEPRDLKLLMLEKEAFMIEVRKVTPELEKMAFDASKLVKKMLDSHRVEVNNA